MRKRSLDESAPAPAPASIPPMQRRTERTHEENQERAYIAASRRSDRSVEARVQSAKMASDIHKRRTGKGFKISEEIVMKEEMYEEEDEDMPRSYRNLHAHFRTSSSNMNNRVNAYITNRVAMASLVHQAEVNRQFEEQFPGAARLTQASTQSMYLQNLPPEHSAQSSHQFPLPQTYQATSMEYPRDRSYPVTQNMPMSSHQLPAGHYHHPSPLGLHASLEANASPPVLTPGSGSTGTPPSRYTPPFSYTSEDRRHSYASYLVDPSLSTAPSHVVDAFNSDIQPEGQAVATDDINLRLAEYFFAGPINELAGSEPHYWMPSISLEDKHNTASPITSIPGLAHGIGNEHGQGDVPEFFNTLHPHPSNKNVEFVGEASNIGTPGGGIGDSWDSWINMDEHYELAANEAN
ncbi:hypothetical protein B0T24DRAFT_225237 [Lasiosphaeria ovina]|uniref:Uncharacterized protein n=1 Tax=Lasiosphaeria ovina TaxID=92902 RepID=A0AAE0NB07_9PEZI|nr:hypothetical protein B0T24DRAFT_225237 [Lasiosphaeria ovina]